MPAGIFGERNPGERAVIGRYERYEKYYYEFPRKYMRLMTQHITDAERERMKEFAATPKYKRSPQLLEPDDDEREPERRVTRRDA